MKTSTTSRKRAAALPRTSKTKEVRIAEAYERLGVKPADVDALPKITPILDKLPNSRGRKDGGVIKAIEFLRGSPDPDARKWLKVYDELSESMRKLLPFEAFCLASSLTPKRVLEVITGACFEQSSSTSQLLAAASHPDIVQATITSAKNRQYGGADRKLLHTAAGFLPQPKTQVTNFFGSSKQQNAGVIDNSQNTMVSITAVAGVESKMKAVANRFNEKLGLVVARELPKLTNDADDMDETSGAVEGQTFDAEAEEPDADGAVD